MQAQVLFGRYIIETNEKHAHKQKKPNKDWITKKQTIYKSLLVAFADQII